MQDDTIRSGLVPNLFIIGAPKCATTSLFEWLGAHPEICPASVKETYYLLDRDYPMFSDASPTYHRDNLAGYAAYFDHAQDETYRLEATPDYLYQATALEVIPRLETNAQVIVVLRKPSERIYSLFKFARNIMGNIDPDISFANFVNAIVNETELLDGRPILQCAICHSRYADYLGDWISALGRERVHVLLFEELANEPRVTLSQLTNVLGIDPAYYDSFDFVVHNRSGKVKNMALHRARNATRDALGRHVSRFIPAAVKQAGYAVYNRLNIGTGSDNRSASDLRTLASMDERFLSHNRRLERLLKRDLSLWNRSTNYG